MSTARAARRILTFCAIARSVRRVFRLRPSTRRGVRRNRPYARVAHEPTVRLLKGLDPQKDQSYFLHAMPGHALARTLFPIGDIHKDEVRRIARDLTLPVFDKKDSTGICFIGERPFAEFLSRYLPAQPGRIETHRRRGARRASRAHVLHARTASRHRIGGRRGASESPWYVAGKDLARKHSGRRAGARSPRAMLQPEMRVGRLTWVANAAPHAHFRCSAKVPYRQADQDCTVTLDAE